MARRGRGIADSRALAARVGNQRTVEPIAGGRPRALAMARDGSRRRDLPVRRVLRDDLIVELAKRQTSDGKRIQAVRGLDRGDLKRSLPEIARHIEIALHMPEQDVPHNERREVPQQINVLGQFLATALTSICRAAKIAPSLVGTASDVRDMIAFRMGYGPDEPPQLARGWRAEVVGSQLDDLLAGKTSIRIVDPKSDEPLAFEQG